MKVTFLRGAALQPPPPVASKHPDVRYLHVHEGEPFDEEQMRRWLEQAAAMPGDPIF